MTTTPAIRAMFVPAGVVYPTLAVVKGLKVRGDSIPPGIKEGFVPHRYTYRQIRLAWWRVQRFIKYRVLHVDDTPHRIALGVAIGFFVTWTPTMGLQMALTVVLCTIFRANKLVGVPFVWISNPLTTIPIYYPSYVLGVWMTPGARTKTLADWQEMIRCVFGVELAFWERPLEFWRFAIEVAGPLWVGGLLMGLVIGAAVYWITYVTVVRYRRRFGHPRRQIEAAGPQTGSPAPADPSDSEA